MKKTAFVAIVGRPNVGKSTLLNAILGEKVAIVSKKPQTTRNRITGIYTKDDEQLVFFDTPGVHNPRNKLGDYMVKSANEALGGVDAVILVVEARESVGDIEEGILEKIRRAELPAILVINKTDAVRAENVAKTIAAYSAAFDFAAVIPMSAKHGKGTDTLLSECRPFLYESDWCFPEDMVTDQSERRLASEIIREKLLRLMEEEIPHGIAVVIEEWKEKKENVAIRAEIYCEKQSHKGMIIGKNASLIKTVGTYAREDLEKMLGTRVYLDLYVRVKENWRDGANLTSLGFGEETV